jgi:multidrug transporter EmrE-like cation transporter
MGYFWIGVTIILSVYGQIMLKWRLGHHGEMPETVSGGVMYLARALMDGYVLSAFLTAFLASLSWMTALTKFDVSHAYPLTAISFILVLLFGWWLLGESMSLVKVSGVALIVLGIWMGSR